MDNIVLIASLVAILATLVVFRRNIFNGPVTRLEKIMPQLEKLRNNLSGVVFELSHDDWNWDWDHQSIMIRFLRIVLPWQERKGEILEIAGQFAKKNVSEFDGVVEDLIEIFSELVCV